MYNYLENNVIERTLHNSYKENYIVDMLVRTLYSNNVNNDECYRIIRLFKEKVLGNVEI